MNSHAAKSTEPAADDAAADDAAETSVFVRLLPYLKPHARQIGLGLFLLLISIPAQNFHPLAWSFIVDEVVGKKRSEMLVPAVIAMFCVQAVGTVLGAWRNNILEKVGQEMVFSLRNDVYSKLQRQSLSYHHENRAGDLVSRAMGDIDQLQEVAVQGTDSIIASALSFLWVAGVLLAFNWRLGLATLLPIFAVLALTKYFNARVKTIYRASRERLGDVNARLQENLMGLPLIKAFAREDFELSRFLKVTRAQKAVQYEAINARTLFFPAVGFVGFFSNVISVGYGAWLVLHGQFTVGGLVAYRGYWWPLFAPINQLANINELLQRAQAAGRRVFEVLDAPETIKDGPQVLAWREGTVEFEQVSFRYNEREATLCDIQFQARQGQMIALAGPSGAGKSSVLNLLLRFYDPHSGRVLIDRQDIKTVTQRSLRERMAFVPQEAFLFNGSVRDNIAYANPQATDEAIASAARSANAHEFIEALPEGYETEIGERGVKLSGGQRQRLAIARAFLADPQILILDEPTSAVEPESEAIVQASLERLMRGRTTFVTSHRLSLIRNADVILVFEAGRLVERGGHAALIEHGGIYAGMYEMQMGRSLAAAQD